MKRSAARSSSSVVTPTLALPLSIVRQRASTRPASAIFSISSGDLRRITAEAYPGSPAPPPSSSRPRLQLLLHPECRDRGPDVVVHLGGRARPVEAPQDPLLLVTLLERLRLVVVDGEPLLHHLGLVVVALDQARAVLVADPLALRGIELDVIEVLVLHADAAPGQAADHLLVRHLDLERRGEPPPPPIEGGLELLRLADGPGEAVEQEAVLGLGGVDPLHDHAADHLVRNQVAAVHVLLRLAAELRLLLDGRAQDVAGRVVRHVEVLDELRGLRALAGPRWPEQE